MYWKRNETEYFIEMKYDPEKKEFDEKLELFCFGRSGVQQLEKEVKERKKQAEGIILDESETEFLQTKPVTVYIPKDKILEKEWRVTGWSFFFGIVGCGGIGYLLYRYGNIWGHSIILRLSLFMALIFLTVTIRLIRTLIDQKSVPARIYISGEYLQIDGMSFWLKDVEQIEFSEKKIEKDKSEQNRWYFQFLYKGKSKSYWLGTESSFPVVKFNQVKKDIRASLAKYPEKLVL